MSKKESNHQLIESLIKQNSALYETIGELQNIAVKYDTLLRKWKVYHANGGN